MGYELNHSSSSPPFTHPLTRPQSSAAAQPLCPQGLLLLQQLQSANDSLSLESDAGLIRVRQHVPIQSAATLFIHMLFYARSEAWPKCHCSRFSPSKFGDEGSAPKFHCLHPPLQCMTKRNSEVDSTVPKYSRCIIRKPIISFCYCHFPCQTFRKSRVSRFVSAVMIQLLFSYRFFSPVTPN